MKLVCWNVNGIRAVAQKSGFFEWFLNCGADVAAFQETKAAPEQLSEDLLNPGDFLSYWSSSMDKKGYSGVVTYSRPTPLAVGYELPDPRFAGEGRLVHLEFEKFHFFNIYFPNGQKDQERLDYKMGYYDAFLKHAETLRKSKPIVVCGDFNTAHRPIDLARPKENEKISGFLPEERAWLDKFVARGYVDTFRHVHGDRKDAYSWWSFRTGARGKNVGWRIDYFFVSEELKDHIAGADIHPEVTGSDHCPISLELKI